MTGRYSALVVTLRDDLREEDAEPLMNAIQQLRGVLEVSGYIPDSVDALVAMQRADSQWRDSLIQVIKQGGVL